MKMRKYQRNTKKKKRWKCQRRKERKFLDTNFFAANKERFSPLSPATSQSPRLIFLYFLPVDFIPLLSPLARVRNLSLSEIKREMEGLQEASRSGSTDQSLKYILPAVKGWIWFMTFITLSSTAIWIWLVLVQRKKRKKKTFFHGWHFEKNKTKNISLPTVAFYAVLLFTYLDLCFFCVHISISIHISMLKSVCSMFHVTRAPLVTIRQEWNSWCIVSVLLDQWWINMLDLQPIHIYIERVLVSTFFLFFLPAKRWKEFQWMLWDIQLPLFA